jgi:hypothetical protein
MIISVTFSADRSSVRAVCLQLNHELPRVVFDTCHTLNTIPIFYATRLPSIK